MKVLVKISNCIVMSVAGSIFWYALIMWAGGA